MVETSLSAGRSTWDARLRSELAELAATVRLRRLRGIDSAVGPRVVVDGRELILCCANDYLGLAGDPRLADTAAEASRRWGVGSGASRLISGSLTPHQELEAAVADWKGCEAAIAFNSGYHANVGVLSALLRAGDVVYSDALNHASLIDGCRLSRAETSVYRHADVEHLAALLQADRHRAGLKLIVTDSVFSMDADEAPLTAICDLAERHDAWVMVDEAHAGGLLGAEGAGLVADLGLRRRVHIQMGTFGKALGSFGAYVAGSRTLIETLQNRARSFVFTTALPPAVAAVNRHAIEIVRDDAGLRERALARGRMLRDGLTRSAWRVLPGRVPIVPVLAGDDAAAMALAEDLERRGVLAVGIRPPTVPEGTARIRLTVGATHDEADIGRILAAFGNAPA